MKKPKINKYLKLSVLFFCLSVLLWNCEKEDVFYSTTFKTPNSINAKTVSFEEAKTFFNKSKTALNYLAKGTNSIIASPDWNSISHHEIPYTDALLTKASVSINKKGKYTSELLFINLDGQIKNVIFTLWKEKVDTNGLVINATVFFNKINGTFIDAYKIENGKFTKRIVPVLKKNIQKATFLPFASFFQEDYSDFWCWILENGGSYTFDDVDLGTVTSNLTDAGGSGGGTSGDSGTGTYFNYVNGPSGDGLLGGGPGVSVNTTSNTQITAGVSAILMNPPIDPDEIGKCPEGYIKNPMTGKCESICNGGKIYNTTTKTCKCPDGKVEDSYGNCVEDPCKDISKQIGNPVYYLKANELKTKTGQKKETGYKQNKDGSFTTLTDTNNGHSLSIKVDKNTTGYMHTHLNNFNAGDLNGDGIDDLRKPIRMFSPADLIKFLQMVKNSKYNGVPTHLVYATMISSSGNYTLRFTGDIDFSTTHLKSVNDYDADYKRYFKEDYKNNNEKAFLHFLKDFIKVDGINLHRLRNNGDIEKKTLKDNGKVDTNDCQ